MTIKHIEVCWLYQISRIKWIELKWGTTTDTPDPESTLDWREKIKLFVVQWLCVMCLFTIVKLEQLGLRSRRTDRETESKYATIILCIPAVILALMLLQQDKKNSLSYLNSFHSHQTWCFLCKIAYLFHKMLFYLTLPCIQILIFHLNICLLFVSISPTFKDLHTKNLTHICEADNIDIVHII